MRYRVRYRVSYPVPQIYPASYRVPYRVKTFLRCKLIRLISQEYRPYSSHRFIFNCSPRRQFSLFTMSSRSPYILSSLLDLSLSGDVSVNRDLQLLHQYVEEFGVYTLGEGDSRHCQPKIERKLPSTPVLYYEDGCGKSDDEDRLEVIGNVEVSVDNSQNHPSESAPNFPRRVKKEIAPESETKSGRAHELDQGSDLSDASEGDEDYDTNSDYDSSSQSSFTSTDSDYELDIDDSFIGGDSENMQDAIRKHRYAELASTVS